MNFEAILNRDMIPDWMLRRGVHLLNKQRISEESEPTAQRQRARLMKTVEELRASPIAIKTGEANEQHYEVPTEFFELVLGPHRKYSCCYYEKGDSLEQAERRMLDLTIERARIGEKMKVLDLGCGWGSFTLYLAQKMPSVQITAVSNSRTQRRYIEGRCRQLKLKNVKVITADMNDFTIREKFDRVVSVEMFEHMRNYDLLMKKVAGFLKPGGLLFVHIFVHREFCYPFEVRDETDWMSKYFFAGGIMPSQDLLLFFQKDLRIESQWHVDGTHYQQTSEHWLANMDRHRERIAELFAETYGADQALTWIVRWRLFFIAVAEFFGTDRGREWFVSHYLFRKP
ncbi:MAG: class I SAM-dependent methyltransferase [Leptonema illini]|uniref:Class I SAM-dependent methyltransferase n=1 Tax=Leptonema illini TaxID=183 RepID=A0A833LW57_9LEPT|nr:MAG: class I SAM-dependent methyltransferase [Leptonema illini]